MGPVVATKTAFSRYAVFTGRACKSEFNWFAAFIVAGSIATYGFDDKLLDLIPNVPGVEYGPAGLTFEIATTVPIAAVLSRRMQDVGHDGFAMAGAALVAQIVAISGRFFDLPESSVLMTQAIFAFVLIVALIFLFRPSQPGPNKYGPNPHEVTQ